MKRKTDNFNKFYNKKRNSAVKEQFKQEKKTAKRERKAAIERHFEEKRKMRGQPPAAGILTSRPETSVDPKKSDLIPLNKYIAHSGVCSRRDAAELVRLGKVTVNDKIVTEPGTKVSPKDLVKMAGKKVTISRNFVYILLNKP